MTKLTPIAYWLLIVFVLLSGCRKEPQSSERTSNGVKVEVLFEKDGCTIYRFYDVGAHYFANCKGVVSSRKSCGKNCSKLEETVTW